MKPVLVILAFGLGVQIASAAEQTSATVSVRDLFPNCDIPLGTVRAAISRVPVSSTEKRESVGDLVEMNLHVPCLAELLTLTSVQRTAFGQFVQAFESRRTDKQAGSNPGTGGTTNLVAKGTTSRILSVAAEYGALTESVNRQIVTVQGSLDGIPAALVRQQLVRYCPNGSEPEKNNPCVHQGAFEALRRISYSVSFDTSANAQQVTATPGAQSQGTAQPVTFEATGQSITGATLRVIAVNARDDVSKAFQTKWNEKLKTLAATAPLRAASAAVIPSTNALLKEVESTNAYKKWQSDTIAAMSAATSPQQVDEIWLRQAIALGAALRVETPSVFDIVDAFASALSRFRFEQQDFVDGLANKPVLTLEYDYKKPTGQPATSTARAIFDKGFGASWSVAFNAAVEVYDEPPPASIPGATRVRDTQIAIQLQRDLGTLSLLGAAAVSGSYYYQYQNSPSILNVTPGTPLPGVTFIGLPPTATQVFAEKGPLHVAQIRLVLGPGQSGARFPISMTYSNRTELITKPTLRAQIGVSYDFDAVFAR
jgi:hypothetical protein